jgi:Cu/Zn superoxide dismutase
MTWSLCRALLWLALIHAQLVASSEDTVLEAHLSQHDVRGTLTFTQSSPGDPVRIAANLSVARNYKGEYSWGIYEFPIDYSAEDYCHTSMLGRKPLINFDSSLNKLQLDEAEATEEDTISTYHEYTSSELNLTGPKAVWGHGIVLEGPSRSRICASLMPKVEDKYLRSAEARFTAPVAGSVWFTSLSSLRGSSVETKLRGRTVETKIFTNLVHVAGTIKSSSHKWQLFITDVLDTDSDIQGSGCDFLQILYDPKNDQGDGCSNDEPQKCREGDLAGKFGTVKIGRRESMFTKSYFHDPNLELPELEGTARSIFLVLYDEGQPDSFLACAKVREVKARLGQATFGHDGMTGDISFRQVSPYFPARSQVRFRGLNKKAGSYHVHEFPVVLTKRDNEDNPCMRNGGHFNPFNVDSTISPKSGGSVDKFEAGDLSGKYGSLKDLDRFEAEAYDPRLSLFSKYSVLGRSIVVHNYPKPSRWTCANIVLQGRQLITAAATFTYPVAGRIIFRQPEDDPYADTSIFVESLIYSDGSKKDSFEHKWHVHNNIPGRDYFNWTGRCLSAGGHYNPYKLDLDQNVYSECENEHIPVRCEVGDLVNKHDNLKVSGRKRDLKNTVKFFTDSNLPLSGPHSIIGRSITIHDDRAPKHRGNRLACTGIYRSYRHKAVAKTWFGNGQAIPVKGRLEFIQATPMDTTHTLVDLHGLNGVANAYHIHQVLLFLIIIFHIRN